MPTRFSLVQPLRDPRVLRSTRGGVFAVSGFGCLAPFLLAVPGFAFGVELSTTVVRPGDTLRILVQGYSRRLSCSIGGQPVPVLAVAKGEGRALIGFSATAKSGKQTLIVKKGGERQELSIEVVPTVFPEEAITLTKEKAALYEDPRIPAERKRIRALLARLSRWQRWDGRFAWPVEGPLITTYGYKRIVNGRPQESYHRGVDIRVPKGTSVLAPSSGKVVLAGPRVLEGNAVLLDHGHGVMTIYMHLEEIRVKPGEGVQKGQVIGTAGSTGISTAPHLHWGLYVHGVPVDPIPWTERAF